MQGRCESAAKKLVHDTCHGTDFFHSNIRSASSAAFSSYQRRDFGFVRLSDLATGLKWVDANKIGFGQPGSIHSNPPMGRVDGGPSMQPGLANRTGPSKSCYDKPNESFFLGDLNLEAYIMYNVW